MPSSNDVYSYGVNEQTQTCDDLDVAVEELGLVGYTIIDPGFSPEKLKMLAASFDRVAEGYFTQYDGRESLAKIDEHNTIRCMLAHDDVFLDLAKTSVIIRLCERILGDAFILNQQNGIINPANSSRYNQAYYHRDLPYQHFISSRPLAINALFCVDEFTVENGATKVVPGSHKQEAFPVEDAVHRLERAAIAPAGSFVVLDSMVFHSGGVNGTSNDRRAINNLYTIPFFKQQINLSKMLSAHTSLNIADRKLFDVDGGSANSIQDYLDKRKHKAKQKK